MPRVTRTRSAGEAPEAKVVELSAAEKKLISAMITKERKAQTTERSDRFTASGTRSMAAARQNDGSLVARYIAPSPGIVPMYMVVPPWGGYEAHVALINQVTKNGKVSRTEAAIIRHLFNWDIAQAAAEGRDIQPKVAAYLHRVLDGCKMTPAAQKLIFGKGGPGYEDPGPVAEYIAPGVRQ